MLLQVPGFCWVLHPMEFHSTNRAKWIVLFLPHVQHEHKLDIK
jgi:hypothetical protein